MNKEQMTQEQREQLIEKLHNEYNELNGKIARLHAFLCDINFIEKVPHMVERELMEGQLRAMKTYLDNLRGRIKFQEKYERARQQLDEWMNMKGKIVSVQRGPVRLVNTDEQHHCGQDVRVQYDPNESQPVNVPVKGDDFDDACCQAREKRPVDDGSAVVNEAQVPNSIKSLVGMLVVDAFHDTHKCTGCEYQERCNAKKVEIVGGYFLCLEELPGSVVTE